MGVEAREKRKEVEGTSMSLLAAVEEERMYSCLHSRGGSDFSDREGCEC